MRRPFSKRPQSIRFRLSALYSGLVFGLGGVILSLLYVAVRWQLTRQTETRLVIRGQQVQLGKFNLIVDPRLEEAQVRTLESMFNQFVLDQLARYTLVAVALLFLISLVVGWVIAGRALAPVDRISQVAREIEASDLSRRIALPGPDDELTRLASTFDGMLDRLEGAFKSQRKFLADTSHDLRTPLSVIRSNVEVMLDDPTPTVAEWQSTGQIVVRNAERMGTMIDGLLAAARFQNGQAAMVTVDLASLTKEVAGDLAAAAASRDIALAVVAGPAVVQAEPVSLTRALGNLVDNALRVAPSGSDLRIASGQVNGWAFLAVSDQGPGFDLVGNQPQDGLAADGSNPIDPYTSRSGQSGGLGLTIVEKVAQLHRGVFSVFSRQTQSGPSQSGSTTVIWLPTEASSGLPPTESPVS